MPNTSINISYNGTSSFVPQAPNQRQYALDRTNPKYLRHATLTQDCITLQVYTSSVIIPLTQLYSVAINAQPALSWPPVIISTSGSSVTTHPSSSTFMISASSETNISYRWLSSSYSQSLSGSGFFPLTSSVHQYLNPTSSTLTLATSSLSDSGSLYYCSATNASGTTKSSIFILNVK